MGSLHIFVSCLHTVGKGAVLLHPQSVSCFLLSLGNGGILQGQLAVGLSVDFYCFDTNMSLIFPRPEILPRTVILTGKWLFYTLVVHKELLGSGSWFCEFQPDLTAEILSSVNRTWFRAGLHQSLAASSYGTFPVWRLSSPPWAPVLSQGCTPWVQDPLWRLAAWASFLTLLEGSPSIFLVHGKIYLPGFCWSSCPVSLLVLDASCLQESVDDMMGLKLLQFQYLCDLWMLDSLPIGAMMV